MEARKEALRALAACRFCLRRGGSLSSIYDKAHRKTPVSLSLQIMACVNIEVFPSDGMPSHICERCVFFMGQCYQFKQLCRAADETLLQFMQTGEDPEPVPWPTELLETAAVRSAVEGVKQGRSTAADLDGDERQLKVGSTGSDEADSDEDDVFNIKIETDEGEERGGVRGGPARIKVTQRDGKLHITEEADDGHDPDAMDEDEELEAEMAGKSEGNKFPCRDCDRTFLLKQQLQIHIKRQHRERNVQCPQCPDKFFSKYDLATHLSRHSDEMPFECVACSRRFKRYGLLKRHEKVKHADTSQFPCKDCSATFLSLDELQAHTSRHRLYENRPYKCPAIPEDGEKPCAGRFQTKSSLLRHLEHVHNTEDLTHTCNYCPMRFSTAQRLARHIKEHAGRRPYPCKYCNKTFIKSHHYTRHLRCKHPNNSITEQREDTTEVYACSECQESFTTQEALAYHEAEHATRSLTCPLCVDKFPDVNAVTEHIKLHADQDKQFMCDYCDLVFVSEERQDQHVSEHHADEIMLSTEINNSTEMESENYEEPSIQEVTLDGIEEALRKPIIIKDAAQSISDDFAQEESEEVTYTELATVDTLRMARLQSTPVPVAAPAPTTVEPLSTPPTPVVPKEEILSPVKNIQTAGILRKAEEVKRRVEQERAATQQRSPAAPRSPLKKLVRSPALAPAVLKKIPSPEKKPATPSRPAEVPVTSTPVEKEKRTAEKPAVTEKPTLVEKSNGIEKQKEGDKEKEQPKEPIEREKEKPKEIPKESIEKEKERPKKADEGINRVKEIMKQVNERERETRREKENEERKTDTPSDKSLRLLEKDLQELKRETTGRSTGKPTVPRRGRPPGVHTIVARQKMESSSVAESRTSSGMKTSIPEVTIRRRMVIATPDRKRRDDKDRERDAQRVRERREAKERREERDATRNNKDVKEKEVKVETPVEPPRRSSRSARIKDYAKMIRDSRDSASSDPEVSEYSEEETPPPARASAHTPTSNTLKRGRGRPRLSSTTVTTSPATATSVPATSTTAPATATTAASTVSETPTSRRRGRQSNSVTALHEAKRRKSQSQDNETPTPTLAPPVPIPAPLATEPVENTPVTPAPAAEVRSPVQRYATTTVPTFTPVRASMIKSLPPGVKPLPLPAKLKAASVSGSICEMKMGEKMVKVQKIVMTKAEVEAMSKKGLLEMKHGTMVLKQGFKLPPSSDPAAIRSTLARAANEPAATHTPAEPPEPMEAAATEAVSSDTAEAMEI